MRFPEYEPVMREALTEAYKAYEDGEVPVGCVITDKDGHVIARGRNVTEREHNSLRHAEICALTDAVQSGVTDFTGCTLYTTLEPCGMCSGAIANFRVGRVIFGAFDPEYGCMFSKINLPRIMGRTTDCTGGVCEDECAALLQRFFAELRQ